MPNVGDIYRSKTLKADDLDGDTTFTIRDYQLQEFKDSGEKVVLGFEETDKTFVVNKTNARCIARMHGNDLDGWIGNAITLFPTQTDYAGDTVACIRVKLVVASKATSRPTPQGSRAKAPAGEIDESEIPF